MLQELRDSLNAAATLVAEIGTRFRSGDPADALLEQLAARIADIGQRAVSLGPPLPDDVRGEVTRLASLVQTVAAGGDEWLADAGPELAASNQAWRVRQAYGLPSRPD